jgi:hypothetical protein
MRAWLLSVCAALLLLPGSRSSGAPGSHPAPSLDDQIAAILPKASEDKWLQIPWRTNLMQARLEAQKAGKPLFLWVMVGNPQGCT